jgi:hypothetical protein
MCLLAGSEPAACRPAADDTGQGRDRVLLESTACGFNQFYELWRRAEAGETEWLPVFLPWFLDKGYRRKADDFEMDGEERLFAVLHRLDAEQMAWRRAKINQFGQS